MAYQQLRKCLREMRKVDDTLTLASQIWLAGLGALARAQGEGRDFFDDLVRRGELMEAVEDDGLRKLKQLARRVLAGSGPDRPDAPTPEEIRGLAKMIHHFDLHLNTLEVR